MTTIAKSTQSKLHLQAGDLQFTFWESGDLYQATYGRTMINQMLTSPIDGSLNNLYLRIIEPNGIRFYPLLGTRSTSKFYCSLYGKAKLTRLNTKFVFPFTSKAYGFGIS